MNDLHATIDAICAPEADGGLAGWCTPTKARWLADRVVAESLTHCVELGVFGGRALLALALAVRHLDRGGFVLGLDPYDFERQTEAVDIAAHVDWAKDIPFEAIHQRALLEIRERGLAGCCGILRAAGEDFAGMIGDGTLDLVHVDGCHSVLASCRDVEVWLPKVRVGGLLVLDDCEWSTVQPARAMLVSACGSPVETPEPGWEAYRKP